MPRSRHSGNTFREQEYYSSTGGGLQHLREHGGPGAARVTWALDLGNTRLKFGRSVDGTLDEVHVWRRGQAAEAADWLRGQSSAGYILAAGHPDDERFWRQALGPRAKLYVYRPGDRLPIRLAYHTPETLGLDRIAAVVGARALLPGRDCVVVSAGTCLTVEHLRGDGTYLGGSIAPGVAMRLRAMHRDTGRLPLVGAVLPKGGAIGRSTAAALQLGAIRGAAHEIAGWCRVAGATWASGRSKSGEGHAGGVSLVVCGGDAPLLRPLLRGASAVRPHLVLEGLAQLHAYALQV